MLRALLALLLVLMALPASAAAGWSAPRRVASTDAVGPRPAVGVLPSRRPGDIRVRIRGAGTETVPDSRGAELAEVAIGGRGVIAVFWNELTPCGDSGGKSVICDARILASVWRSGRRPPPGRVVARLDDRLTPIAAGVGDDGTVLLTWIAGDDTYGGSAGLHAAVARGAGRLEVSELRPPSFAYEIEPLEMTVVRGRPQLAWNLSRSTGRTDIHVTGAHRGRLDETQLEARVPDPKHFSLIFLRSTRGHRLLVWKADENHLALRSAAPGRPLGPIQRDRTPDNPVAALGRSGDFAIVSTTPRLGRSFAGVVRGRAGRRPTVRQDLRPSFGSSTDVEIPAGVAVDSRGRTYIAWTARVRGHFSVAAAVAGRDKRSGRRSS